MIDIFISHASEDKQTIVEPLVKVLEDNGISYWYDKNDIGWGDSIVAKINEGLETSKYIVFIISRTFLSKKWTQIELNTTLSMQISSGEKKVLPIIVGDIQKNELPPLLQDKKYIEWSHQQEIVDELKKILGIYVENQLNEDKVQLKIDKFIQKEKLDRGEQTQWNNAKSIDSKIAYGEYIDNFAKGTYIEECLKNYNRIYDFDEKPQSYETLKFIEQFPIDKNNILYMDKACVNIDGYNILVILLDKYIQIHYAPYSWDNLSRKWGNKIYYNFLNIEYNLKEAFKVLDMDINKKNILLKKTLHIVKKQFYNYNFKYDNGVRLIIRNGKYGMENKDGKVIFIAVYDIINRFFEGDLYHAERSDGNKSLLTRDGKVIFKSKYRINSIFEDEGLVILRDNNKYGLGDFFNFMILVHPRFDLLRFDYDSFIVYQENTKGRISLKGEMIEELKFSIYVGISNFLNKLSQ
jgi:hypothetical protein